MNFQRWKQKRGMILLLPICLLIFPWLPHLFPLFIIPILLIPYINPTQPQQEQQQRKGRGRNRREKRRKPKKKERRGRKERKRMTPWEGKRKGGKRKWKLTKPTRVPPPQAIMTLTIPTTTTTILMTTKAVAILVIFATRNAQSFGFDAQVFIAFSCFCFIFTII